MTDLTREEKLRHYIEALTALSEGKEIECLKRNLDGSRLDPHYHVHRLNFAYPVPDFGDYDDFRVKREPRELYAVWRKEEPHPYVVCTKKSTAFVRLGELREPDQCEIVKFREVSDG